MAQFLTSTTTRSLVRQGPQLLFRSSKHISTTAAWAASQQKLRGQEQQQKSMKTAATPRLPNDADDVESLLLYRTPRRGGLVRGYSTTTTTEKTTPELRNWSFEEVCVCGDREIEREKERGRETERWAEERERGVMKQKVRGERANSLLCAWGNGFR